MEICWPLLLGSWLIWLGSKWIHTDSSSSNKRKIEYRLEITKSFLESNFPLHLPSSKKNDGAVEKVWKGGFCKLPGQTNSIFVACLLFPTKRPSSVDWTVNWPIVPLIRFSPPSLIYLAKPQKYFPTFHWTKRLFISAKKSCNANVPLVSLTYIYFSRPFEIVWAAHSHCENYAFEMPPLCTELYIELSPRDSWYKFFAKKMCRWN